MANDVMVVSQSRALSGLTNKLLLGLRVPLVCSYFSAVRGSRSSQALIVNTEILVSLDKGRSSINQRLLYGRFFHDDFASYPPFVVRRQLR